MISPVIERLPVCRLARRPLSVVRALEFMIPGSILEEVFKRRRMIVNGGKLDLGHALIGVELELRAQLQSCDTAAVDVHQVQTGDWNGELQPLLGSSVSSRQK